MKLAAFLFSFRGRVNRRANFAFYLLQGVLSALLGYAYLAYFEPYPITLRGGATPWDAIGELSKPLWPLGVLQLALLWPMLAVAVKRAHDRDRGFWFVLLLFSPLWAGLALTALGFAAPQLLAYLKPSWLLLLIFLFIWPLVELVFLRGTVGDNRFGSDPLEGKPRATWKSWAIFFGFLLYLFVQGRLGDPWQGVMEEMLSTNPNITIPIQRDI